MKPLGPVLLFAGRFLFTVLISVIVMGLLHFLFLPGSVLESCTVLRICPFLPRCPFYDDPLWMDMVSYFSILISNFIDLIFLPLFLDEPG